MSGGRKTGEDGREVSKESCARATTKKLDITAQRTGSDRNAHSG